MADFNHDQGQVTKRAVSIILSFLVFVFLTCVTLLASIYLNLFEPHTVLRAIRESGFYEGAKSQFEETAWDITIPLGLPQGIVTDLVSLEQVKLDVDAGVVKNLDNQPYTPDTSALRQTIESRVAAHFSSQGKTLSENQRQVLGEYQSSLAKEYTGFVSIPLLDYCGAIKASYSKLIFVAIGVLAVFLVLCVVIILFIRKHKHRGLRYLIYATISAAVATGILPALSFISGFHGRISITPAYFKAFVVKYMDQCLYMLLTFSLLFILITVLLFVGIHFGRRRFQGTHRRQAGPRRMSGR